MYGVPARANHFWSHFLSMHVRDSLVLFANSNCGFFSRNKLNILQISIYKTLTKDGAFNSGVIPFLIRSIMADSLKISLKISDFNSVVCHMIL